jgi:formate-dependent phosphoribosylglycinamide formyltransferase (GAR transformylase)
MEMIVLLVILKKFFPYEVQFAESYTDYIIVCFTIDLNGEITNIYIRDKYQSDMFLESIKKYLKNMEKWKPGQIGNSRVKTRFYYPFYWTLN